MHISAPFIRRPIATSLLTAAVLLITGGVSFFFLPVAPVPQVEFPTISVGASLPGASPETWHPLWLRLWNGNLARLQALPR